MNYFSLMKLNHPLNVQIEITEKCNHNCFYCYNSWQINKKNDSDMDIYTADYIIDKIHSDIKPFYVTLTGGEPFLNMSVLEKLVKKLPRKNIDVSINTNLTLTNKENLESLLNHNNNFSLLVSLPHFKEDEYEYITGARDVDAFFNNLYFVKENTKIPVMVNMVISKYNINSIYEEGKFLYQNYSIDNFAATPVSVSPLIIDNVKNHHLNLDKEDILSVYNQLSKLHEEFDLRVDVIQTLPLCFVPEEIRFNDINLFKRPCGSGRTTLALDYKGKVRPCIQAPYDIGNLFESTFDELWKSLEPFRENENLPDECLECTVLDFCNGGCRFNGFKKGNSLKRKDPRMNERITAETPKYVKKINLDKKYSLTKGVKYRKESDEVFTFVNSNYKILFVNKEMKNFLLTLEEFGNFNPQQLLKHYSSSESSNIKLKNIFTNLISKEFLI